MDVLQHLFGRSADAVFATDVAGRIVYRNESFDRLCPPARGGPSRRCYDVLCGYTLDGKRFCGPDCHVASAVLRRQQVNDFDVVVPQPNGDAILVNVGACAMSHKLRPVVGLFILRPINVQRFAERIANNVNGHHQPVPDLERLTRRERSVLQLLSEGNGTHEIASELNLKPTTVRNHIRTILQKLAVHNRAAAVSYAYRKHLV